MIFLEFGVFVFLRKRCRFLVDVSYGKIEYTVSVKLGRVSVGSAELTRSGIDDLLSSNEGGKHDYDW